MLVLFLIIVCLSGYLVYDKVFSDDCSVIDNSNNNEDDKELEEVSKIEEDDKTGSATDDKVNTNDDTATSGESNEDEDNQYLGYNMSKVEKYKNANGSYGIIESITYENDMVSDFIHYVTLDLAGNVVYEVKQDGDSYQEVILMRNVIDILSCGDGVLTNACFYALDNKGNVYKHSFGSLDKYDIPEKKFEVSKVKRLIRTNICYEQGCSWVYIAVTDNGDVLELSSFGV